MNVIVTRWITKILTMKICLRILIIFPFLLECYEKLSPSKYTCLKKSVTISGLEAENIKNVLKKMFELLVHLNFMLRNIILILLLCTVLSWIIGRVAEIVGCYIDCNNQRRRDLLGYIVAMYIYGAIIIYDIALLSSLILDDTIFLKIINYTSVFWISKFPFISLVTILVISLIIPIDRRYKIG